MRRFLGGIRRPLRAIGAPPPAPTVERTDSWFWDHYEKAAGEVISLVEKYSRPFEGAAVADIGCGDGITDLGLAVRTGARRVVGFDLNEVDVDLLLRKAVDQEIVAALPSNLEFVVSGPEKIPADDASFDILVTWSAFEHVANPLGVLREMRRIVKPDGVLMLQLWPFYFSEHGSHLWDWFPNGFAHLTLDHDALEDQVRASDRHDDGWTEYMLAEFATLNRVTLDSLGAAIHEAGFSVRYLDIMAGAVHLPGELEGLPLSSLGITGVQLLAVPRS